MGRILFKQTIVLILILFTAASLNAEDLSLSSSIDRQSYRGPALKLLFAWQDQHSAKAGFSIKAHWTTLHSTGQTDPSNAGNSPGPPIVETGSYSWQQNPNGTSAIHVGLNAVRLMPCPRGVSGSDQWHYLYISGTGTPEAVLITGGSCVSGAPSGAMQSADSYRISGSNRVSASPNIGSCAGWKNGVSNPDR